MMSEGGVVPTSDSDALPNRIGRYEIKALKEKSRMACVYEAYDPVMNRPVALKQLRLDAGNEARKRFRQEIAINRDLRHFAIVDFYEDYPNEAQPYFTMKWMVKDLHHRLANEKLLDPAAILPILERVTKAVDYAHDMRVSHLDIKPANILFDTQGNAYLSDFGIAAMQFVPDHDDDTDLHPPQFTIAGTKEYMSREQLLGSTVGYSSDIFSLGVVLFEMLSGSRLYVGDERHQIEQRANDETALKRIRAHGATKPFERVLSRALARDEQRRQKTGRELYESFERAQRTARQRQTWYRWVAVGLGALALLTVVGVLWGRPLPPVRPVPTATARATEPIVIAEVTAATVAPGAGATAETVPLVTSPAIGIITMPTAGVAPMPTAGVAPLPTAAPSVAPAPPAGPRVTTTGRARVRSGPGRFYGVITVLLEGIEARVLGRAEAGDGQWYNIELDDGRRGWISELVVLLSGSPAEVPVAATIPAPPPTVLAAPVATPATQPTPPPGASNLPEDTPNPEPRPTNTVMPEPPTETPIPEGYGYGYGG